MTGVTLDTGALIAMERADKRMRTLLVAASEDRLLITVPAVVVAEWWRGRNRRRLGILETVDIEPTSEVIARSAGEAAPRTGCGRKRLTRLLPISWS